MSCHFHMLRRRKTAEMAQNAAQTAPAAETDKKTNAKPEAAQKAATARKKGDA